MQKQLVVLTLFIFAGLSEGTLDIPLMVGGDYAVQAATRFMIFFAAGISYLLTGVHSGYRRQTPHTKPEYEQIVEILDVPEDVYQKRKDLQRLPEISSGGAPSSVPQLRGKRLPNKSDRKGAAGKKRGTSSETPTVVAAPSFLTRMLGMVVKLKPKIPCSELKTTSKLYKRNCVQKPNHVDAISFMYPNYRDWKHTADSGPNKSKGLRAAGLSGSPRRNRNE